MDKDQIKELQRIAIRRISVAIRRIHNIEMYKHALPINCEWNRGHVEILRARVKSRENNVKNERCKISQGFLVRSVEVL